MSRVVVLLGVALMLVGCGRVAEEVAERAIEAELESEGGGDVDIDMSADGTGEISFESEDGSGSVSIGGDLPEQLTVPLVDGYDVVSSSVSESDGEAFVVVSLEYSVSEVDALVEFYDGHFSDMDGVVTNQSSSDGIETWSWSTSDFATTVNVTHFESEEMLSVGVTQQG